MQCVIELLPNMKARKFLLKSPRKAVKFGDTHLRYNIRYEINDKQIIEMLQATDMNILATIIVCLVTACGLLR